MTDSKTAKAEQFEFDAKLPDGFKLTYDKLGTVTNLEAPKMEFDKYRETHIDFTDSLGEAYKSLSVETYMTAAELFRFVKELIGCDR